MRTILIMLAVVISIAICGCTKPPGNSPGAVSSAEAGAAKPAASDEKIAEAVKTKFAADPKLKGEKINVEVKDARVKLTGTISSDFAQIRAEDTAQEVDDGFGVDAEKLVAR